MNPHVISTLILVGHWLLVIALSLRVISRRSPLGVSVAWLAVMFSVPLLGAVAYLLFGEKRLSRARAARSLSASAELRAWQGRLAGDREMDLHSAPATLQRLAETVIGFPPQSGNRLDLLQQSDAFFDALLTDIESARNALHLSFYIWDERGRGGDVLSAIGRAAERGVACRLLADALGSRDFLAGKCVVQLRQMGVQVLASLPNRWWGSLLARADLRNHRKLAVVDGVIAYVGSQNLVDPRFFKQQAGAGEWVDAMVRMRGPVVAALDAVFELDWSIESGEIFRAPGVISGVRFDGTARVQVAPSGPGSSPEAIHDLLLTAIYGAHRRIIMTTPYFVPDDAILTALMSAAQRGVCIDLVVPAHNDSWLVRHASGACFDALLSVGANINLYRDGMLHAKSLTIDDQISIFGSVNLDMRSFWLNFELSMLIYDAPFTADLGALQRRYLRASDRLDLTTWRRRPRARQLTESVLRLVGPLL